MNKIRILIFNKLQTTTNPKIATVWFKSHHFSNLRKIYLILVHSLHFNMKLKIKTRLVYLFQLIESSGSLGTFFEVGVFTTV